MATATELVVEAELANLLAVAAAEGWQMKALTTTSFLIGFSSGSDWVWVHCLADDYPGLPPAWRWTNAAGDRFDEDDLTPRREGDASTFFHPNGVICAPWNRLSYTSIDSRGPHNDWDIGDWKRNSQLGGARTLAGIAIRLGLEVRLRFRGFRQAA
jgi:hypothetical protein